MLSPHIPSSVFQVAAFQRVSERVHSLVYLIYQHTALRTTLFWIITKRVVVISYRCYGTTYRYHFQGSRILVLPEKTSTVQKCHTEQESLGVRYPKAGRKPKVHVQITVFKKILLSERREYKLWLWRTRTIHTYYFTYFYFLFLCTYSAFLLFIIYYLYQQIHIHISKH
jgi:hypothetical protein